MIVVLFSTAIAELQRVIRAYLEVPYRVVSQEEGEQGSHKCVVTASRVFLGVTKPPARVRDARMCWSLRPDLACWPGFLQTDGPRCRLASAPRLDRLEWRLQYGTTHDCAADLV